MGAARREKKAQQRRTDDFAIAVVLRIENVPKSGAGKTARLSMMFHTQLTPLSFL